MRRTAQLAVWLAAPFAVLAALVMAEAVVPAAPAAAGGTAPVIERGISSERQRVETRAYWTEARMARATAPRRVPHGAPPGAEAPASVPLSLSTAALAAGMPLADGVPRPSRVGLGWGDPDASVAASSGRLFFTSDGTDYACSGTAVTSENRSVIVTAAHCLYAGGRHHTRIVFAPGRRDSANPFGLWVARDLAYPGAYLASDESVAYDVGMVVVDADEHGRRLVDVVGGQGIRFNVPRGQAFEVFGYPTGPKPPYDGERLILCRGTGIVDRAFSPATNGLGCDMREGASGGAWLTGFDGDVGYLNSVSSYFYPGSGKLYGPYFGPEILALYQAAQSL